MSDWGNGNRLKNMVIVRFSRTTLAVWLACQSNKAFTLTNMGKAAGFVGLRHLNTTLLPARQSRFRYTLRFATRVRSVQKRLKCQIGQLMIRCRMQPEISTIISLISANVKVLFSTNGSFIGFSIGGWFEGDQKPLDSTENIDHWGSFIGQ